MLEVGFDVTGFERSEYVGGLWHYTEQDKTSVLPSKHTTRSRRTERVADMLEVPSSTSPKKGY